jgi:hypothetical protein
MCKVGMYYHKHHLTAYMMSMGSLEVFYPSTSSSLWEFESCLEGGGVALAMKLKTLNLNI